MYFGTEDLKPGVTKWGGLSRGDDQYYIQLDNVEHRGKHRLSVSISTVSCENQNSLQIVNPTVRSSVRISLDPPRISYMYIWRYYISSNHLRRYHPGQVNMHVGYQNSNILTSYGILRIVYRNTYLFNAL